MLSNRGLVIINDSVSLDRARSIRCKLAENGD